MTKSKDTLPVRLFETRRDWEAWLEKNHAKADEIWVKFARKDSGVRCVARGDALGVALCYGWIDGQTAKVDETFWLQRFTPRRPRSKWSRINCRRVEELASQGLMKPAGLKEVEAAKRDGRWERAYESQLTITVPDDLQKALNRNPRAKKFFATLDSQNRYAILYRLQDARRPETRARRIEKFVAMLGEGKTIHPR